MPRTPKVGDRVIHPQESWAIGTIVEISTKANVEISTRAKKFHPNGTVWVLFDDPEKADYFFSQMRKDGAYPFLREWRGWIYPEPPEDPRKYYDAITEKEDA